MSVEIKVSIDPDDADMTEEEVLKAVKHFLKPISGWAEVNVCLESDDPDLIGKE